MPKLSKAVMYGVGTIFTLAIITSLFVSLILTFTDAQESSFKWVFILSSFASLFLGGFVAGGKGKQKGLLLGGLTGLLFTLIIFLFQFLGVDQLFTSHQWLYHLIFTGMAMIGGIFGVNTAVSRA